MGEGTRSPGALPKAVGRYQIQGLLGVGAMGAVYKGFDPLIKRTLAIKTIRLDIPRGTDEYRTFLERFYQEARISGTLAHPNIVTLYDIGEDNGLPFLALEFIEGQTLEKQIAAGQRFPPERVLAIVKQVASALDYAHSKGIIHRDVKPANVMLFEDDRVKITDFGIAKLADSDMTRQGQLLGTPSYMSPEQAMGEKLDGRSDIFSLGIVSFEMLSGQQPFQGNNVTAILYKLVNAEPVEVEASALQTKGLVPDRWQQVFKKVLAKKRDDRYQTAEQFAQELENCLGALAGAAAGVPAPLPAQAEPSVVISLEEVTAAMPPAPPPPAPEEEDDDLPVTIAIPGPARATAAPPPAAAPPQEEIVEEDELPPTVAMERPSLPEEDDDLPPTIAVPRPAQEHTVLLPSEGDASKPASQPPVKRKPVMPSSFRGAIGTTRLRMPPRPGGVGPGSKPPSVRSLPPGARSFPPGVRSVPPHVAPDASTGSQPPVAPAAGGKLPLILGGVALLIVVVVGVVFALRGGLGGGVGAGGAGSIVVETQPPGAAVSLNGQAREATTPTTLNNLALGTYTVAVELKDYDAQEKQVVLKDGAAQATVSATLTPAGKDLVDVDILSRPAGATVYMDGERQGQTPLRGFKARAGVRRFRIETEGYATWTTLVTLQPGKPQRVDARLERLAPAADNRSLEPPAPGARPRAESTG